MTTLRESVAADDVEAMKKNMEVLQQEVMAMGQAMYQQPGAPGPEGGAGPQGGAPGADGGAAGGKKADDNVIDAEFTDK